MSEGQKALGFLLLIAAAVMGLEFSMLNGLNREIGELDARTHELERRLGNLEHSR